MNFAELPWLTVIASAQNAASIGHKISRRIRIEAILFHQ